MAKVIVHGASSFLGKHFLRKLVAQGIPAHIVARSSSLIDEFERAPLLRVHRYVSNIQEVTQLREVDASPVFVDFSWHGVFGTERNMPEQLTVNIPLVLDSIQIAHHFNCRHWIGFGSQAEYGNRDNPISEHDVCAPTTLYGKSKLACAQLSAALCNAVGMEHSWLRLFSVYGPDDNHEWLIQYLVKEMLANRAINVTKGEQLWDYLYVDDISTMLLKLIEAKGVGVANLGSGKGIAVRAIIEKIKAIIGSDSQINFGAIAYRDDQVMRMEADIAKLSRHLGWTPETSLDEGLARTIAFLRNIPPMEAQPS